VGLVIVTLTGIITLSLSFAFLVAVLIDVAILIIKVTTSGHTTQTRTAAHPACQLTTNSLVFMFIQGFSVVLAYSLAKDLDPKRVGTRPLAPQHLPLSLALIVRLGVWHTVVVGSSGAPQQQEFSFSEGAGAVEMHTVGVQPGNTVQTQVYSPHHHHHQPTQMAPSYNPVTGTFGLPQPQPQPQPVGYPVAPFHPYGYPSQVHDGVLHLHAYVLGVVLIRACCAVWRHTQGMGGYTAADMAPVGFAGDRYDLPRSQPIYENDIINVDGSSDHSDTTKIMGDLDASADPFADN
jgi:hypothetical protein